MTACNLGTWEAEAGLFLQDGSQHGLQSEFLPGLHSGLLSAAAAAAAAATGTKMLWCMFMWVYMCLRMYQDRVACIPDWPVVILLPSAATYWA